MKKSSKTLAIRDLDLSGNIMDLELPKNVMDLEVTNEVMNLVFPSVVADLELSSHDIIDPNISVVVTENNIDITEPLQKLFDKCLNFISINNFIF